MGTCPVCSANVREDFGLIECEGCGAQLIVHVDGTVEYSGGAEDVPAPQPVPEPEPEPESEDQQDPVPIHHFSAEDLSEPPAEPTSEQDFFAEEAPEVYQSAAPDAASPDLSDLEKFANSADSGGREGPFRYTLMISGIDTSDLRLAFREAITDRKLMWDTEQILRSIKQGEVRIANISPGKANIVINRLRGIPVTVRWEQNAVTSL